MALTALGGLLSPTLYAQTPVSYANGDLLLGFRATGGTGAAQDYLVNIGQASLYTAGGGSFTVPGLGAIQADLSATFSATWNSRADVFWSISGATGNFAGVGADPAKTLYATRVRTVPASQNALDARWTRRSESAQTAATAKMSSLAGAYKTQSGTATANNSTVNSPVGVIQNTTDTNSYASFQNGGTTVNSGPAPGFSFAHFNPTIEGTFASGTAGSVLELYRLLPSAVQAPGRYVGKFGIDNAGVLTFTPASPVAIIGLSSATASVSETGAQVTVTINRTEDTSAVSVNLSTGNGTAVAGTDYTGQTNTVVAFGAGEMSKTVNVLVANRAGVQGDRTFTVSLSSPSAGAELDVPNIQTVTVLEAETAVSLASATYPVVENVASGKVVATVSRTGNLTGNSSVTLSTGDGTAIAGTDYSAVPGTVVSFIAGESSKTVDISIANRLGDQGSREFTVNLSSVSIGTSLIAPTTATVTISDFVPTIPGTVALTAATYPILEGAADVTLTVTAARSNGVTGAISVDVTSTGGTATTGSDYTGLPATLSWANGETGSKSFNITIKAAAVGEMDETIVIALGNIVGGASLGAQDTATVSIVAPGVLNGSTTSPKANAKVTAFDDITLSGIATATNGVNRVEVTLNGVLVGTATPSENRDYFAWSLNITPEQGSNVVSIKVIDQFGTERIVGTQSFNFVHVRKLLAGSYNGLVTKEASAAPFDYNGLLAVTVSTTGTLTGKITLSGVTIPFKGSILNNGDVRFGAGFTTTLDLLKNGSSLGLLALNVDPNGSTITGTIKTGGALLLAEILNADHAYYTSKPYPELPLRNVPNAVLDANYEKGKYTALFQANAAPNNGVAKAGFPQGSGVGQITVSASGVVKIVGKLADGSAISYANALSVNGEWPVFIPLYAKKGFVTGNVAFDDQQLESDASSVVTWLKPNTGSATGLYPSGWPNGISSDFVASKFVVAKAPTATVPIPPNPDTVLGLGATAAISASTANLILEMIDGGLATKHSHDVSIDAKSKLTVLGATTGETGFAANPKAVFVATTGALSGSFIHPTNSKTVKFTGVAYQKTNMASGYFHYIAGGGVAESGAVDVSVK